MVHSVVIAWALGARSSLVKGIQENFRVGEVRDSAPNILPMAPTEVIFADPVARPPSSEHYLLPYPTLPYPFCIPLALQDIINGMAIRCDNVTRSLPILRLRNFAVMINSYE